VDRLIKIRQ